MEASTLRQREEVGQSKEEQKEDIARLQIKMEHSTNQMGKEVPRVEGKSRDAP